MGWQSSQPGHTTQTLTQICTKIDKSAMQMGDAILNQAHGHVIMFDKWVNSDAYMAYQEQQTGTVAMYYQSSWSKVCVVVITVVNAKMGTNLRFTFSNVYLNMFSTEGFWGRLLALPVQ